MPLLTSPDALKVGTATVDKLYLGSTQVWTNLDADVAAFYTASGITDTTQKAAINTLVLALKSASVWTKLRAIYPFVGGSASTHKWNLKDPRDSDAAYRLTFAGTWTHSSTGAKPDGSTAYADTHFLDSTWSTGSASLGVYSRTDSMTALSYDMGAVDSDDVPSTLLVCRYSNGQFYAGHLSTTFPNTTSADGRGFFVVNRSGSTSEGYKNGSRIINTTDAADPAIGQPLYLGAARKPSGAIYFSPKEHALTFIGNTLTQADNAALYTAVQAFQTTLGRNV